MDCILAVLSSTLLFLAAFTLNFYSTFPFNLSNITSSFALDSTKIVFVNTPFCFFVSKSTFIKLLPSGFIGALGHVGTVQPQDAFTS